MTATPLRASHVASAAHRALDAGAGILHLLPTWVPRSFCVPGRRLKLHPDDYFSFGGERGGIDERWFASSVRADNGPLTGPDEGLSFAVGPDGDRIPLDEAVEHLGPALIGERLWDQYGKWTVYSKFFDNLGPLPFHVHHRPEQAALVGRMGKPEAYYFPPQLNNHGGEQPLTYFGLRPGVGREDLRRHLTDFGRAGDNRITDLSTAYRNQLGTGWDVPAGVLHAPASLCTYEPQSASDVFAMFESWTSQRVVPDDLLWKDIPPDRRGDVDAVLDLVDWELNLDPRFAERRFAAPIMTHPERDDGVEERWIVYRSPAFSAKEMTVLPGRSARVVDASAYGCIAIQGRGTVGGFPCETPSMLRFGQPSLDEYFVSEPAAHRGVVVTNTSSVEPLVLLKHFGPGNPDNSHVG